MQRGHSSTPNMSTFGNTPAFSFGQPASATPAAATPAPAAFGGFGFGAPAASTAAFGGFGTTAPAATSTAPAFGGFGAPAASTSAFGGFGAPAPAATSTAPAFGGFGAPAASTAAFGGFGAPAPAATSTAPVAFGGFGAPAAAASPFGQPAQTGFGGFGQTAPQTAVASGFGAAPLGFGAPFGSSAAPQHRLEQFPGGDRVADIQLSYAPLLDQTGLPSATQLPGQPNIANEAMCKFDTIIYNQKPSSGSRHQANTGSRWEQAERDNPDPEALEPVRELGIAALRKRFENQNTECVKYRAYTADLRVILEAIDKSTRQTCLRVEALKAKQAQLYNKMLSVVRSVEVLRCRGVSIDSSERRYRERLERLMSSLRLPHAKLQELIAMQSQQEKPTDIYSDTIAPKDIEAMCMLLKKQREGLQHLTDIMTKDARDISIVNQRLKPHTRNYQ